MRNGLKDSASVCMYGDMENLKCMQDIDKSNEQESSQDINVQCTGSLTDHCTEAIHSVGYQNARICRLPNSPRRKSPETSTLDRQITSEKVKFHNIISLFFCITGSDEFIFGISAGRNSPLLALLWHAPTMAALMNIYRLSK